jgi:threonine dehydrogenase-like Zn-dependent dehydrogenase
VIVTDVHDYRLEMAKTFGATHTINARRDNVVEAIAEITKGHMADIAVEAVGVPETRQQVFDVLHPKGLAVIFGMPHGGDVFPFNWWTMYEKLPRMIVVNSRRAGEVVEAVRTVVDLVGQGRLDFSRLVTHRVPFENLGEAYDMFAARRDGAIKVVISV